MSVEESRKANLQVCLLNSHEANEEIRESDNVAYMQHCLTQETKRPPKCLVFADVNSYGY
jgi:hypothetical protein